MGQQQLLLLVLGIVIVGLAVVVGLTAFEQNLRKSNADQVVAGNARIAALAQTWKMTASAMGGGQSADGFEGFSLSSSGLKTIRLGGFEVYQPTPNVAHATSVVSLGGKKVLVVEAYVGDEALTLQNYNADGNVIARTIISGVTPETIQTDILQ